MRYFLPVAPLGSSRHCCDLGSVSLFLLDLLRQRSFAGLCPELTCRHTGDRDSMQILANSFSELIVLVKIWQFPFHNTFYNIKILHLKLHWSDNRLQNFVAMCWSMSPPLLLYCCMCGSYTVMFCPPRPNKQKKLRDVWVNYRLVWKSSYVCVCVFHFLL